MTIKLRRHNKCMVRFFFICSAGDPAERRLPHQTRVQSGGTGHVPMAPPSKGRDCDFTSSPVAVASLWRDELVYPFSERPSSSLPPRPTLPPLLGGGGDLSVVAMPSS